MTKNNENTLICPACSTANQPGATRCASCGTDLATTVPVQPPGQPPRTTLQVPDLTGPPEVAKKALVISVAGHAAPVFLARQPEMVLGRRTEGQPPPALDLTRFNGHMLGVSRRHAVIRFEDDTCTIEDLASVNGTWVNENRIAAGEPRELRGGEQVRLGNLIMFIYFSAVDSVYVVDTSAPRESPPPLTPDYLAGQVVPFLKALDALQAVLLAALGRDPVPVLVGGLASSARNPLNLRLGEAGEALHAFRSQVMPWKRTHQALLAEVADAVKEGVVDEGALDDGDVKTRYRNARQLLIQAVLKQAAPTVTAEPIAPIHERLQAPLEALAFSPLELAGPLVSEAADLPG